MTPAHLRDGDVAKEPEIVQEDAGLIFRARGAAALHGHGHPAARAASKPLRLWSGTAPREAMTAQPPP